MTYFFAAALTFAIFPNFFVEEEDLLKPSKKKSGFSSSQSSQTFPSIILYPHFVHLSCYVLIFTQLQAVSEREVLVINWVVQGLHHPTSFEQSRSRHPVTTRTSIVILHAAKRKVLEPIKQKCIFKPFMINVQLNSAHFPMDRL